MGNKVRARYESEGVVCPPKLKKNLFTTAAVDNIDHNPSSTTAQGAFHGTGISLFQHPSENAAGEDLDVINVDNTSKKAYLSQLPEPYTTVQPVIFLKKEPPVTILQGPVILSSCLQMPSAFVTEYKWLDNVRDCLNQEITKDILNLSWAAYHASQVSVDHPRQLDLTSLMLLFKESAHSAATIRHAMEVLSQAVRFLNPGQVPVLACDEPLFAIAKKIQWNWPAMYGEQKLVVM